MANSEGSLAEERREVLKMESQNAEVMASLSLLSSLKSSTGHESSGLSEHRFRKVSGSRHLSALQSGKFIRVQKGM